jgi:hypothetical protein
MSSFHRPESTTTAQSPCYRALVSPVVVCIFRPTSYILDESNIHPNDSQNTVNLSWGTHCWYSAALSCLLVRAQPHDLGGEMAPEVALANQWHVVQ